MEEGKIEEGQGEINEKKGAEAALQTSSTATTATTPKATENVTPKEEEQKDKGHEQKRRRKRRGGNLVIESALRVLCSCWSRHVGDDSGLRLPFNPQQLQAFGE